MYLINHKKSGDFNNIKKKLKEYLFFLENQLDGLSGGFTYSYFTFNSTGMEIFLKKLKDEAEFSFESRFLDVGSGRGHLVFCVANILNPIMSYGIEGDDCRYNVETIKTLYYCY
jgi:hypothetical protein